MINSTHIRDFLDLCRRVYDKGFVSGSGGNISIRLRDQLLITPSGRNLGALREEDLVFMDTDGTVSGPGKPSKEWRMHLACYARTDVAAVVHVHSFYAVALSCTKGVDPQCAMPAYTPGYGLRVGKLPLLPYLLPGSEELAGYAAVVIAERDSVLLANHGLLAVGASMEQAMNLVEEIEENARLCLVLGDRGFPLSQEQCATLTSRY
jgi:ribulose-5-phosphate 4-epimerase/fuculose-1-phosphate aldolase